MAESPFAFSRVAEESDGGSRNASRPPLSVPLREIAHDQDPDELGASIAAECDARRATTRLMSSPSPVGMTETPGGAVRVRR